MKHKSTIFWLAILAVLFAFLQIRHEFHFYYVEQNQLFQNDFAFVADMLFNVGGLAAALAEFLVQFFIYPFAGAAITAVLLTAAGWLCHSLVKKLSPDSNLAVFCLLPVAALLFVHLDYIYLISGTAAFIFALLSLRLVLQIRDFYARLAVEAVLTVVLFLIAGSVFALFALLAVLIEILFFKSGAKRFLVLILAVEAVFIAWLSIKCSVYGEYRFAVLPDLYYNSQIKPGSVVHFSWISMVILIIAARLFKFRTRLLNWISLAVQAVIIIIVCRIGLPKYEFRNSYETKKFDYYCRTEQWNKILEEGRGKITNYLKLCYINLALSERGELAERMFDFDQRDPKGLMAEWNKTTGISLLNSDIAYSMNCIALSQEMAFEAHIGAVDGGNPRALKRLVETNLIFGAYPVAEKYIAVLENTLAYRDWAKSQRRFLYDDSAVENDAALGVKLRSIPDTNSLSAIAGLDVELQQIAEKNPDSRSAIEYLGALLLLAKDFNGFKSMIERYSGTPVLPRLPRSFQEAVCVLNEANPSAWASYGVSDDTASRFNRFKQTVLANKNNRGGLPSILAPQFGNTYWYFVMFK
ncbi:MAG: DUF6057 family protein [Dysgonamonadaceae bacterium]|jgi:hypothetical protein|nr:DUF6057 family protein [Dysgonamonadaceae bacterium]